MAEFANSLPGYTASTFPLTLIAELPGVTNTETGTQDIWNNIDLFLSEYRRVQLVPSRNAGLQVSAWGGNPVSMPVTEVYNAMQTGVIDGAMIDTTATRAFRLGEVANYLTLGFDATNSPFYIIMNQDAFDGLSADNQKAVVEAGQEASLPANKTQLDVTANGITAFAEMEGKEVIERTAEEAAVFNELFRPHRGPSRC
ncbi:TRAP transporter substrate-binding protein DctP [Puniceibacterium sediminis]|uniref:Extracellular solute-binding protein, family 7 n=1 Tax=Puniceibacterium sediminis TaxID=1608407 RepID=A0A238ZHZ8_9RHOB|nr:TRAP transporter substrate-binding protein DctP [Puniceibacterium sediminis]SNR82314.1 extracellular solute-binding protein, family 7 [Puniceibacterium sediminis]